MPTPFCSHPCPITIVTRDDWDRDIDAPFAVECLKCDVSVPCAETEAEAVRLHELRLIELRNKDPK